MTLKFSSFILKMITALLCIIALLLSTPWGSQLVVAVANNLPLLSLQYKSGALNNNIKFDRVEVFLPDLVIQVDDVEIDLQLSCLIHAELCVNNIKGNAFYLKLDSSDAENDEVNQELSNTLNTDDALIDIPFTFSIEQLHFNKVDVIINDIVVAVEDFSANALIAHELIQVNQPNATNVSVMVATSSKPEPSQPTSDDVTIKKPINDKDDTWALTHLPTISIPLDLQINELITTQLHLQVEQQRFNLSDIALSARWIKEVVTIDNLQTKDPRYGKITLNGNGMLSHPYPINLTGSGQLENFPILPEIAQTSHGFDLKGDVTNLELLLKSSGKINATTNLQLDAQNSHLPFKLTSTLTLFPIPDEFTEFAEFSELKVTVSGDKTVQQLDAKATVSSMGYQHAIVKVRGRNTPSSLSINSIEIVDKASNSDLIAQGKIIINDEINWQLAIKSNGLTVPILPNIPDGFPSISGDLSGDFTTNGRIIFPRNPSTNELKWLVQLSNADIKGQLNQTPFSLFGDIKIDQSLDISSNNLSLSALNSRLNLSGYSDKNYHFTGDFFSENIAYWLPDFSGKSSNTFEISGPINNPKIKLKSKNTKVKYQQISADNIAFELFYQPLNNHQISVDLSSQLLRVNHYKIKSFSGNIQGDLYQQKMSFNWQGDIAGKLSLENQYLTTTQQIFTKVLENTLSYKGYSVLSNEQINVNYNLATEQIAIKAHCWRGDGLNICLNKDTQIGEALDIDLSFSLDEQALGQVTLPHLLVFDGSLDGFIKAKWQKDIKPSLTGKIDIHAGRLAILKAEKELTLSQWSSGELTFELNDNLLTSEFFIMKDDANNPELQRKLISAKSDLTLNEQQNISADISLNQLNLRPIQAFVPDIKELNAYLSSTLQIEGSLTSPQFSGNLNLNEGSVSFNRSSNQVKNVEIKAELANQQLNLSGSLNIDDDPATITAKIDWQKKLTMEANFDTDYLSFSSPPNLELSLSSHLTANLSDDILKLGGKVTILDGLLALEELPEDSISVSEDVIIINDQGEAIEKSNPLAIESTIDIVINEKFKLEGHGFEGNLSGDLKVRQARRQPIQLLGTMTVLNGYYQAYGQHLNVEQGKITFNGPATNPHLDFRAGRQIKKDDVKVGISISGLADAMQLQLYSEPSMEQPEILSYLIRGSGLDAGSGNAAAMGIALSTTLTKATNLTSMVEELPILRDISVDTEVDGEQAQATISGYIGERIYLKYGIGIYEPVDEITVRLYLLNRLWLETVSGIEKSADIYYSFDID